MKVIITGGNGFVGKYLAEELRNNWEGVEVISWDLPEIDITKPETYRDKLEETKPDWIVHLAAMAKVAGSEGQEEAYTQVNVEGTRKLLEAAREVSPETKFLVASSADVYGKTEYGQTGEPVSELNVAQCEAGNVYSQSKLDMEKMIEDGFNDMVIRVRPFPHLGAGQLQGFVTSDIASQIAKIEKGEQEYLNIGNTEAKRDFLSVRDVVRAYRLLMEKSDAGEVYNVASGEAHSIQEILDKLIALSPNDIEVRQDETRMRPSDVPVLVGDASKLRALTGWQPEVSLDDAFKDVLDYWRSL